ncbi:ABC transporter ATP-binding protein [Arcticibacterium luteifluviistationis]|uniref:Antibiotic ABC transporter ATP-binding protein n=1 Tax=Arcticibacterium luteifluviistationis TaxID=1784714 RepID=A0A2Z4GDL0_9BACT|nr:ABC transporter ATP-binding protein [Arcticibacterium luteifluviistationis]AWV99422.1 antibiotic ABC transporter ATP-binding protein [Arcticibacterium luteifluviistationis]
MNTYFKLLSYAGNLKKFVIPFLFTSLLAAVFGVLNLVLLKPILDVLFAQVDPEVISGMLQKPGNLSVLDWFNYYFAHFLETKGKLGALQFVCIILVLGIFIGNIFRYLSLRLLEGFKVNMVSNLRQAIFNKSLLLPIGFFNNQKKGDIISRITTDVQEVENSIANTFSAAIKELFLLVGYLIALFYMSFKLTLFALIVIPVTATFLGLMLKKLRHDAGEGQSRLSNIMSLMDETFGGMRVVKGFVAENFISKKFETENQGYKRSIFSYAAKRELANPFSEVVGVSMVASLLFYGGSLILSDQSTLDASTFMAYIALFSQVVRPAKTIAQAFSASQRGIASGDRILEVLNMEPEISDSPDAVTAKSFENTISFEDVSFAYEEGPAVLRNINFKLEKGKTVALVGQSGGGKSTLADLLPRFYEPTEGHIKLDGTDINDISQASLRSLMGIVTQDPVLFNDSIYNNITFGKDVSREDVLAAAKIANAHEFIEEQSEGYETIIGDRGVKLSGGQRQRISIARAILQNPPILILDEATSALDTESEKLVQDAITHLMKDRTSLVIAHRLSTIQHADEILVVDKGQIAERGTHQELYTKADGIYHKLVELQEI